MTDNQDLVSKLLEEELKNAQNFRSQRQLQMTNKQSIPCQFFYWGPMLCKVRLHPDDLKKCAKLCSKQTNFVNSSLAGVIEEEHYMDPQEFSKIIEPYLISFRNCYRQWHGVPLSKKILTVTAWVNFMKAGEYNPPHLHAGCNFSSVLFIKIPDKLKEERSKFIGSGGGPGSISFLYGEFQEHSISQQSFFPEEGDFFIFPATLIHFVAPFMCKEERISIGANFKLA